MASLLLISRFLFLFFQISSCGWVLKTKLVVDSRLYFWIFFFFIFCLRIFIFYFLQKIASFLGTLTEEMWQRATNAQEDIFHRVITLAKLPRFCCYKNCNKLTCKLLISRTSMISIGVFQYLWSISPTLMKVTYMSDLYIFINYSFDSIYFSSLLQLSKFNHIWLQRRR